MSHVLKRYLWVPYAISLLATALRFYHLGDKGLWGDEIAQAQWSLFTLNKLWAQFREPPDFILHFLLGHFTQQFGTSEFWVRLPSAVTGLLAVPVTYVAARRLMGPFIGIVAMFLIAVSPEQIWYAQDARMYAAQAFYGILAFYFFLRLLDQPDWRVLLGLTVASILGAYNHLFGLMPILIQAVAVVAIFAYQSILRRRAGQVGITASSWRESWALYWAVSLGITVLAMLPLLQGTLAYIVNPVSDLPIEAAFQPPPFQLSLDFARLLINDFGIAPDLGWRMLLSLALALVGVVALFLRAPRNGIFIVAWLSTPLLLLQLTHPAHTVANRYLLFMQPVYLLTVAAGVVTLALGTERLISNFPRRAVVYGLVSLAFLVLISLPSLQALYGRAKLNDWQTVAKYLATHAEPGDILADENGYWGVRALSYYLPNLNEFSSPPGKHAGLEPAMNQRRNIWYISFGGDLNPEDEAWIKANLARVPSKDWMRPELSYTAQDSFTFTESEELVTLYHYAGQIPAQIVYAAELGDHKDVRPFLPVPAGSSAVARLQLAKETARALRLTFHSAGSPQMSVLVDGQSLPSSVPSRTKDGWTVMQWTIPPARPNVVTVEIKNNGSANLQIRSIELYADTAN